MEVDKEEWISKYTRMTEQEYQYRKGFSEFSYNQLSGQEKLKVDCLIARMKIEKEAYISNYLQNLKEKD